jgi:hypothetical protein
MPALTHEQLIRRARFVFEGTVQKDTGGEVPGLPGARAAVVRVDHIVQGPDKLTAFEGREVTVILQKDERVQVGERAMFYTNGAYVGDTLAVESIGHLALPAAAVGMRALARPAAVLHRRDLQERLDSADMVVVGRVSSVRLPPPEPGMRALVAGPAGAGPRRPISEHDPDWREAVIDVDHVEMGGTKRKQVVVHFPASDDVRWHKAPKFTPGQEGVFILHRTPPEAGPPAARLAVRALAAPAPETFTALHPADVQPADRQDEINTLVNARAPGMLRSAKTSRSAKAAKPSKTVRSAKAVKSATATKSASAGKSAGTTRGARTRAASARGRRSRS